MGNHHNYLNSSHYELITLSSETRKVVLYSCQEFRYWTFFFLNAPNRVRIFWITLSHNIFNMLGSKAVQAVRQFSTTTVRRSGHAYQGPGHVSWKMWPNFFWLYCENYNTHGFRPNMIFYFIIFLLVYSIMYIMYLFQTTFFDLRLNIFT